MSDYTALLQEAAAPGSMPAYDLVERLAAALREAVADKDEAEEGLKLVADLLVKAGLDWYTGPHDAVGKLLEERGEAAEREAALIAALNERANDWRFDDVPSTRALLRQAAEALERPHTHPVGEVAGDVDKT